MSPSENDLRAALRDGEGDGLNVERIVTHGRARARRRTQLLNGAAITVVVAGLGVGLTLFGGSDENRSNASDQGGGSQQSQPVGRPSDKNAGRAPRAAGGGAATAVPSAQGGASARAACPESLPRYLLPPTATDAAGGSLFSGPVASVVVCAFRDDAAGQPGPTRLELKGQEAKALVHSLEQTSVRKPGGMCPDYRRADEQSLAVIGLDASGDRVGVVTTTLGRPPCAADVRNGKVVRYGWQPPAGLTGRLTVVPGGGGMSHIMVRPSESPTK